MPNADLTRLTDDIQATVPSVLEAVLKHELFDVVTEFLARSNIWQQCIEVETEAGERDYTLVPMGNARIERLLWITNANDLPVYGTMRVPGELRLHSTPSNTETLSVTVALNIKDPTSRDGFPIFPDWVLAKYREALIDGVKGRLLAQPAKPYANERLAIYHTRRFRNAMAEARVEAQHQNVYRGQAWRFPRFA